MPARNPALGFLLVVLGAGLFIQNAGVSRVALRAGVDPASLTTLRVTGTFVVLLLFAVTTRRSALRPPPSRRLAGLVVVHGVVGVAAMQWTYFIAIDRLPVGLALLLEYQAPILVALWARFVQHERVRGRIWVGLALAWGGLGIATGVWRGSGAGLDPVGVAAGLGAAVCVATYFLVGEHGVSLLDPWRVILWSFGCATVALNLVHPVTGVDWSSLGDHVDLLGRLAGGSAPLWAVLGWIVVVGTVLPFAIELLALRHLSATTVTMVAMLEPVGVIALGWVWFSETLGALALAGCLAVVTGIVLAQSARRVVPLPEPPHLG